MTRHSRCSRPMHDVTPIVYPLIVRYEPTARDIDDESAA
ncbi:hypothetical protein BSLA_03r1331 [Burkholderia stabilis]|nr:hypothetical protein BSLA_03r1331 [Burkholderia stabilis]